MFAQAEVCSLDLTWNSKIMEVCTYFLKTWESYGVVVEINLALTSRCAEEFALGIDLRLAKGGLTF